MEDDSVALMMIRSVMTDTDSVDAIPPAMQHDTGCNAFIYRVRDDCSPPHRAAWWGFVCV